MTNDLRADLDQLFAQRRHRPILDRFRRRQRAQEVAEIVVQRVKLETNRVGGEGTAGKSRPFDRSLALLDPLFARAALVVEGNDILCRSRHVGDDESEAGIKLSRMPLDLGDDPVRLRPASGLIREIGMGPRRRGIETLRHRLALNDLSAVSFTITCVSSWGDTRRKVQ
jgi:hypothetical protein